ncbi:PREDICTED: uncharacterized protein LOC108976741 [Bactrocera latifrons]|uniref:Uncharacterized protein n=1 Tax=Bactrocera latifrons TaxID=174628 RepID=A0A0K8UNS6_BACLA|nr:PREDICTED: uncharacterized protein LOC108976741 [Bactrocera latifrons]XP_018801566.1 PREDICTED: uncharacterized protein LOC108976741 [Bactrocera latifrons]XP_018801576.1 PREDICTED: uncharacterized protein LOC108976741 [Bactrocera latifrons]
MTSSNINKIIRSNITLKPWILSKNTSEIVNTCIQKIYKQSQNNFKNDQNKIAAAKPENRGPIRALKMQERTRVPLSINVTRSKKGPAASNATGTGSAAATAAASGGTAINPAGERLASNAAANNRRGAVANLSAHRRLLKSSPNYKIYGSRRFGSSASSSNASIFRRNEERRRTSTQTAQLNYLLRTYATQAKERKAFATSTIMPKFMVSARNQHMAARATTESLPAHVIQTASAIQRDLMPINSVIKDRIALGRTRSNKMALQKPKSQDPMSGWHHPPSQELFQSRFNQRGIANTELQEQYRRMKTANKMRQFEQLRQMEKRNAILGNVGKKPARQHVLEEFENKMKIPTSNKSPHQAVRHQTPQFEHSYLARVTRQQQNGIADTETTALQTVSDAASTPTSPTTSSQAASAEQNNASTAMQTMGEMSYSTNEASTLNAAGPANSSTPDAPLGLPMPEIPEPDGSVTVQINSPLAITKKSPTSQWAGKAAQHQYTMRFNHSAHLKKF